MTARYQWELKYETNRIKQSREIGTPLKFKDFSRLCQPFLWEKRSNKPVPKCNSNQKYINGKLIMTAKRRGSKQRNYGTIKNVSIKLPDI